MQGVLEHLTFSFDGGPNLNFAEGGVKAPCCILTSFLVRWQLLSCRG